MNRLAMMGLLGVWGATAQDVPPLPPESTNTITVPVTLAWDPSPDAGVGAYRVHWGIESGAYRWATNAGASKSITVQGLTNGVEYYFAATAVDTNQLESDFSNEVSWVAEVYSPPTRTIITLTPVALHSTNLVDWNEVELTPTVFEGTNAMEFWKEPRMVITSHKGLIE